MKPLTHDKRGRVTSYGFACGYQERYERGSFVVWMYGEHNLIHVRAMNRLTQERIAWEAIQYIKPARKAFARLKADARARSGLIKRLGNPS